MVSQLLKSCQQLNEYTKEASLRQLQTVDNQIARIANRISLQMALSAQQDSADMRVISIATFVFLPATATAVSSSTSTSTFGGITSKRRCLAQASSISVHELSPVSCLHGFGYTAL
ncbi:hypothetical protein K432DRAFT_233269 [Lepidopterella palustris CBS 459.81]|uniref:Uncharacterized protein n=1 Tax=Lepidopterella palustris CBS 459.81 TaxID=1314670 RepID=A0A8E2J994_9PEZI|nr:hypothetical protein K432DRAFT_233269 [Lepidopterella palustris CBS 459.81]